MPPPSHKDGDRNPELILGFIIYYIFLRAEVLWIVRRTRYQRDFLADLRASPAFDKPGNGGFVESCIEHVAAQGRAFNTYKNGVSGLTMQQALTAWWRSGLDEPAAKHWQMPCMLHPGGAFGQCNPTCTQP
eukprot:COSAG01_NODE_1657_length_9590_cov_441.132336_11_plen_131_part_00